MMSLAFGTARLLNAAFFVSTCVYCLLSYSPFAYEQFIRPQLIGWLPDVVAWHHQLFWLTVLVTLPTLLPALRRGTPRRRAVPAIYLGLNVLLGLWLTGNPVLALAGPDTRTLVVAILCLVPPLMLAVVDHVLAAPPALHRIGESRLFLAAALASVIVWLTYALLIPWYVPRTPGVDLSAAALGLGVGMSLASHVLLFTVIYVVASAALSLAALFSNTIGEYWTLAALWLVALALLLHRVVATALSFGRAESWVISIWLSIVVLAIWSGCAWQRASSVEALAAAPGGVEGLNYDAIDLWFSPIRAVVFSATIVGVLALPALAFGFRTAVAQFDWNFLLQKLGVCVVWVVALGWASALTRRRAARPGPAGRQTIGIVAAGMVVCSLAAMPAATRLTAWNGDARIEPEFVLDRYAAFDASYHLIRDLLKTNAGDHADFYSFLKAHSTIRSSAAVPADVNFVTTFEGKTPPPHVFLFIVDSLRRDYLSPYNPQVTFTPAVQAFAGESVVFERAFSRYGATGLSVPALFAGGMLLHKQYVTPFSPTNALEKLLDGAGYRRFMSDDHLVTHLFRPSPSATLLDERVQEMDHTMCGTVGELQSRLEQTAGDPRPVFFMTRSLQLHPARLIRDAAVSAAAYDGFVPGYAAQVAAADRCLGEFVAYLKRTGLYDRSVVILTSDHGESLGEDGRWGHAYTLYPEVVQIPLIIHLPKAAGLALTTDRSRLAMSTDITPTLYALAGEAPRDLGALYGRPLFTPTDRPIPTRRNESFLLSSSYGPVYAMLRHNGRLLYISDAMQGNDLAYQMRQNGQMERVTVTDAMRTINRRLVRAQIALVAAEYQFSPTP